MTPTLTGLQLCALLHYYMHSTEDYPDWNTSPTIRNQIIELVHVGLLHGRGIRVKPEFEITEKGQAHVDHLCQLPLPVQVWAYPKP